MFKNFDVIVDTVKGIRNQQFAVNTNDLQSLKFSIAIKQADVPVNLTGATVRLAVKKPDKTTVFQDCTITDATAGKCEIVLTNQAYLVPGLHAVEVMIYYTVDTVAVTGRFSYIANKGFIDDETLESSNDWPVIQQILVDAPEAIVGANAAATNANQAADTAKTNWKAPVANFAAIATANPAPALGDTVQCLDNGFVYRYNGSQWVYTQGYSATALADVNAQLAQKAQQSDLNETNMNVSAANTRIDNIIATPTTISEQEIIDARKGEASLGAKIGKIDTQISDSSLVFKNILLNSNFANGSTSWSATNATINSAVNNELKFIATAYTGRIKQNVSMVSGHKYYLRLKTKTDVTGSAVISVNFSGAKSLLIKGTGNFEVSSQIFDWDLGGGTMELRISDSRSSAFTEITVMEVLLIDLTVAYGAKIPTNDALELVIAKYASAWFEGNLNIFDAKKASEELSSIDKNWKNVNTVSAQTNLFDGATWKTGYYLDLVSGAEVEKVSATLKYTENYIPVRPNTSYVMAKIGVPSPAICYDYKLRVIGAIEESRYVDGAFTTNERTYYIRPCRLTSDATPYLYEKNKYQKLDIPWLHISSKDAKPNPSIRISDVGVNSFIGAYNFVFDKLLTAKPKARIIMISHYSEDDYDYAHKWKKLVQVQKAIAEYWGIPICMLNEKTGWVNKNGHNIIAQYCTDGIHPDTASYPYLADIITPFLKSFIADGTGKKFAWYGTSIPARDNSYADLSVAQMGGILIKKAVPTSCIRANNYDGSALQGDYKSFTRLTDTINYQNSMLDLIGTANEPDYFVFDFGVNDYSSDKTDCNLFDVNNQI